MSQIDLSKLIAATNSAHQGLRTVAAQNTALRQEMQLHAQEMQDLKAAISRVSIERVGDPNVQRVENIPGRRIPFDLLVDITIPAGQAAVRQGTITISQEGPFVAVSRMATLMSLYEFQYTDPESGDVSRFQGRSYGRYRPIHSAWDIQDGNPFTSVSMAQAFPGTGSPHIASPSNAASFRSMQGDYRILMRDQGASFPRSNQEVPSSFWTKSINEPWELGALDFFERNTVLVFNILPTHAPNPAFGNLQGFGANPSFPFLDSQWDAVEGINDQAQLLENEDVDPVVRQPNAILTIGFHGYLIVQPAGSGQY